MGKKIDYYFDFLSPYSYLSWNWLKNNLEVIEALGHKLRFRPVVLGSVIKHYDTKGPAEIDSKREYLFKDCLRFSKLNNIDFNIPKKLPFNSLCALRCSLKEVSFDNQIKVIDTLFKSVWADQKVIDEPEFISEILSNAGLNGKDITEGSFSKEARVAVKRNLKDALNAGVFGLPSFVVEEKELFWGNDSVKYLLSYLKNEDLVDQDKFDKFKEGFPFL